MSQINIIYSWDILGKSDVETYISEKFGSGSVQKISGGYLKSIVELKNKLSSNNEKLNLELIDEDKDYYIYYNLHSSSGYQTEFEIDINRNIRLIIKEPTGYVLNALWSEVKILEII